jgi:hypothetical protein
MAGGRATGYLLAGGFQDPRPETSPATAKQLGAVIQQRHITIE